MPVKSVLQLTDMLSKLSSRVSLVGSPLLIMHGREDHTFDIRNARDIFDRVGSSKKEIVIAEHSYHILTLDEDQEMVRGAVASFLGQLKMEGGHGSA